MPWCDDCSKFWNPPELVGGSRCPSCGETLASEALPVAAVKAPSGTQTMAPPKRAPWHFKLLVVGVAGYMVYRVIWFIEWLPKHV